MSGLRSFRHVPRDAAEWAKWIEAQDLEGGFGNPPFDGYVLASTVEGDRFWVPNGGGGGGDWTLNIPQTGFLTPEANGGIVDRAVLQYRLDEQRWEDYQNLDLPDGGYVRFRNAAGGFTQWQFDADLSLNITGLDALNFQEGDRLDWTDITFVEVALGTGGTGSQGIDLQIAYSTELVSETAAEGSSTLVNYTDKQLTGLISGRDYIVGCRAIAGAQQSIDAAIRQGTTIVGGSSVIGVWSPMTLSTDPSATTGYNFITDFTSDGNDVSFAFAERGGAIDARCNAVQLFAFDLTSLGVENYGIEKSDATRTVPSASSLNLHTVTIGDGVSDYLVLFSGVSVYSGPGTKSFDWRLIAGSDQRSLDGSQILSRRTFSGATVYKAPAANTDVTLQVAMTLGSGDEEVDQTRLYAIRLNALGDQRSQYADSVSETFDSDLGSSQVLLETFTATTSGDVLCVGMLSREITTGTTLPNQGVHIVVYNITDGVIEALISQNRDATEYEIGTEKYGELVFGNFTQVAGKEYKVGLCAETADFTDTIASLVVFSDELEEQPIEFTLGDPEYVTRIDGSAVDVRAPLTASSYGGVLQENLLDKTATEEVSGDYTFSGSVDFTGTVTGVGGFEIPAGDKLTGIDADDSPQDLIELVSAAATPGDSDFASVSILASFDGADEDTTFTAETGEVATFEGNAKLDDAQTKFGTTSLLLDGDGDYVTFPDEAGFDLDNDDFTIEAWVWLDELPSNSTTNGVCICASYLNTGNQRAYFFEFDTSDQLRFVWALSGTSASTRARTATNTPTLATGQWYHCAVTRDGSTIRLFLDGVELTTTGDSIGTSAIFNSNQPLALGYLPLDSAPTSLRFLQGRIEDFRLTLGVARYTSGFTPPAAAFPDSAPVTGDIKTVVGDTGHRTVIQGPSVELTDGGPAIYTGTGTPESAVEAIVGSLYLRSDGGTGTTLYVKESGTGNTGWVAK